MARPFTRTQQLENRAFLRALEQSGNIRMAARAIGRGNATMHGRRAACAAFAQRWDATLAIVQARLAKAGRRGPEGAWIVGGTDDAAKGRRDLRTRGGEPVVVRRNDGKLQVRRAQPGKLTQACEQAFLAALSATANVALSAAAAGAAEAAFYRRRRQNAAFAREMRLALQQGYERLELAMLEGATVAAHADDAWRHNDPPPMPRMTPNQALQLMYLHQKEARLQAEPPHLKRRRGETTEAQSYRFAAMYRQGLARDREAFEIAEAARAEQGEPSAFEPAAPSLPALDQVTGWSKADPAKRPHSDGVALFGGWRIGDMKARAEEANRINEKGERRRRSPS